MATTFTRILLHITFSTKNRQDLILPEIEQPLWKYVSGIVDNFDSRLLAKGGTADHVHMLVSLGKATTVVDLMENVKKESSKWMKEQGSAFRRFYWQEGYGAFSIGESGVEALTAYIARQKAHHQRVTFKQEFLGLLKKYRLEYNERYLWR